MNPLDKKAKIADLRGRRNPDQISQDFIDGAGEFSPEADIYFEKHLQVLRKQVKQFGKAPIYNKEKLWYG